METVIQEIAAGRGQSAFLISLVLALVALSGVIVWMGKRLYDVTHPPAPTPPAHTPTPPKQPAVGSAKGPADDLIFAIGEAVHAADAARQQSLATQGIVVDQGKEIARVGAALEAFDKQLVSSLMLVKDALTEVAEAQKGVPKALEKLKRASETLTAEVQRVFASR